MTWSRETVATLVDAAEQHSTVLRHAGPSRIVEIARSHPGAFSIVQRRPMLAAVVIAVAVCGLAVLGTLVAYQLFGPSPPD